MLGKKFEVENIFFAAAARKNYDDLIKIVVG